MTEKSIEEVKNFWESNPLWTGESAFEPGSKAFFEEHRQVYITDCFAGKFDSRCIVRFLHFCTIVIDYTQKNKIYCFAE